MIADLDVGIFFALAVSSLSVIGVLMAGWGSANKYSLMGGLRAGGQLIAYELPMVLAVVGVVIQAGTLNLNGIVDGPGQRLDLRLLDGLGNPFILTQFVGFFIFLAAVQAELTQTPFDMPVAESELGRRLPGRVLGLPLPASFFLAEFATAFAFAGIAATLFLGGWGFPRLDPDAATPTGCSARSSCSPRS